MSEATTDEIKVWKITHGSGVLQDTIIRATDNVIERLLDALKAKSPGYAATEITGPLLDYIDLKHIEGAVSRILRAQGMRDQAFVITKEAHDVLAKWRLVA